MACELLQCAFLAICPLGFMLAMYSVLSPSCHVLHGVSMLALRVHSWLLGMAQLATLRSCQTTFQSAVVAGLPHAQSCLLAHSEAALGGLGLGGSCPGGVCGTGHLILLSVADVPAHAAHKQGHRLPEAV